MFRINTISVAALVLSSNIYAAQPDENNRSQPAPSNQAATFEVHSKRNNDAKVKNAAIFTIDHFQVLGNTLLDAHLVDEILIKFTGKEGGIEDIQQARLALENAYRKKGYQTVRVLIPQQEVSNGTVVLTVIEFKLGSVAIKGNQYHDQDNIVGALPALVQGKPPSSKKLSENLRLANENPSRHLDVTLAEGGELGTLDAQVNVQDESPQKIVFTFDNTGNASTGWYRVGVAYQNSNLFNRDHAATLSYTTSPDHVSSVQQISGSYRLPLYSLGDSLDAIAAYTDTNAGTTNTVAGPMSFSGKGYIGGVHYNHYFGQEGEYTSHVTASLDYRAYVNDCSIGAFGPAACGSAAASTTVHPIGLTYGGAWNKPSLNAGFSASAIHNLPGGGHGGNADFAAARPSPLGLGGASANYSIYQLNGSALFILSHDWRLRLAARSQYTRDALIAGEQIGLSGMNTVRGYMEREASSDNGYVENLEIYTPNVATRFGLTGDSLRLLAFIDQAQGWNVNLAGETSSRVTVGSAGMGVRYDRHEGTSLRLDVGRAGNTVVGGTQAGSWRGHISLLVNL